MKLQRALIAGLTLMLTLALLVPAFAQGDAGPVAAALDYIGSMQNPDGGFTSGFSPESDMGATADVVIAFVAAGDDPNTVLTPEMFNPYYFLGQQVEGEAVTSAGQLAKIATAVVAGGKDVTAFGGHDLVADLLTFQGEDGVFGGGAFDHCLSLIALENAGAELPEGAVEATVAAQGEDGGWGFMAGEASDTNTTSVCLQALALTGQADAVQAGLDYLAAIQNEDGGWPYQSPSDYGTDSDVNSTALVAQALVAAGEDLAGWNSPQDWIASMQLEDGAFAYQAAYSDPNLYATIGAVPALAGVPLNAWAPVPEEG